jgi:hypothetical protein
MITVSSDAQSVLAGAGFVYKVAVESWRGGVLLADNVPIASGGEETDRSIAVPERATFRVPRVKDGVDWTPTSPISPLAAKGQHLHVKLGIGLRQGATEWLTRARLLIYETEPDGDALSVTAVGRLELVNQARLISPFQPTGTFLSTLRALVEPALTVVTEGGLVDRAVPAGINYDEDRLGAVNELLDSWPAQAFVDPEGYLRVSPPSTSTTPVLTLTEDGVRTIITLEGSSDRSGGANVIVARGQDSTGAQVQGVAYIVTGPDAYGGPYNPLPVPFFFQSPLLTTTGEATAAALTIRDRRQRQTATTYTVTIPPNPTIQAGDVVGLTSTRLGLAAVPCVVDRLSLPYAALKGSMPAMALTVRTLT